mmetsp:Transcript_7597/g.10334  ORF Transcript_7597/g.10334 Transcript_7597/m.10334 type:complete len:251 (-) Transcript_7597:13-765(-)
MRTCLWSTEKKKGRKHTTMKTFSLFLFLTLGSTFAFNANLPSPRSGAPSMPEINDDLNNERGKSIKQIRHIAAITAASMVLTTAVLTPDASLALSTEQHIVSGVSPESSSIVLSARSGGRSGGRASGGGYSRPSYSGSHGGYSGLSRTTIVQPRTTIVAPPQMMYGSPSFLAPSPFGGFGLGYGLGAAGAVGDALRDMNQESEIQRSRQQLEESRMRTAEMEMRLRQLEQNAASIGSVQSQQGAPAAAAQ